MKKIFVLLSMLCSQLTLPAQIEGFYLSTATGADVQFVRPYFSSFCAGLDIGLTSRERVFKYGISNLFISSMTIKDNRTMQANYGFLLHDVSVLHRFKYQNIEISFGPSWLYASNGYTDVRVVDSNGVPVPRMDYVASHSFQGIGLEINTSIALTRFLYLSGNLEFNHFFTGENPPITAQRNTIALKLYYEKGMLKDAINWFQRRREG